MNDGCDGFENEKEGNGLPPEIKRWGAGSIYYLYDYHRRQVTSAERSCKSVKSRLTIELSTASALTSSSMLMAKAGSSMESFMVYESFVTNLILNSRHLSDRKTPDAVTLQY